MSSSAKPGTTVAYAEKLKMLLQEFVGKGGIESYTLIGGDRGYKCIYLQLSADKLKYLTVYPEIWFSTCDIKHFNKRCNYTHRHRDIHTHTHAHTLEILWSSCCNLRISFSHTHLCSYCWHSFSLCF